MQPQSVNMSMIRHMGRCGNGDRGSVDGVGLGVLVISVGLRGVWLCVGGINRTSTKRKNFGYGDTTPTNSTILITKVRVKKLA